MAIQLILFDSAIEDLNARDDTPYVDATISTLEAEVVPGAGDTISLEDDDEETVMYRILSVNHIAIDGRVPIVGLVCSPIKRRPRDG